MATKYQGLVKHILNNGKMAIVKEAMYTDLTTVSKFFRIVMIKGDFSAKHKGDTINYTYDSVYNPLKDNKWVTLV